MAKKLIHDFRVLVPQTGPQRVQIDGVWTRIVFFGNKTVPADNVWLDGALAVFTGTEVPTVYDWPAVRDSAGDLVPYGTYVDISTERASNDPIGFLITARLVDRP